MGPCEGPFYNNDSGGGGNGDGYYYDDDKDDPDILLHQWYDIKLTDQSNQKRDNCIYRFLQNINSLPP